MTRKNFVKRAAAAAFAACLALSGLSTNAFADTVQDAAADEAGYDDEAFLTSEEEAYSIASGEALPDLEALMGMSRDENQPEADLEAAGDDETPLNGKYSGDVLYFIPHQDDDLLTFACSIIEDLKAGKNVFVVLCTDGRASRVYNAINAELRKKKQKTLTVSEFIAYRDQEFRCSLQALGVPDKNIYIPYDRLVDGTTADHMDKLTELMRRYIQFHPKATVCANMPVAGEVTAHTDHADIGMAAVDLRTAGEIEELRLFIDSYKYDGYLKAGLPEVKAVPKNAATDWTQNDRNSFSSAMLAYQYGSPYGIGYRSSGSLFSKLYQDPHSYCYTCNPDGFVRYGGKQRYQTAQNAAAGITQEGTSAPNFLSPECESVSGKLEDISEVPDSERVLVYENAIVAPHRGSGTAAEQKGSSARPGGTIVLAYGRNFPDALAAAALGFEIMLTPTDALAPEARDEILRTLPGRIVIMGAASVVSDNVVKEISRLGKTVTDKELEAYRTKASDSTLMEAASGSLPALIYEPEIVRCGGKNRYETALELVRLFGYHSTTEAVIIATGTNYADAVSIAPYAAKTGTPILLAKNGDLTANGYKMLDSLKYDCSQAIIVGGSSVVSDSCRSKLMDRGLYVTRLAGLNRYKTSEAVAEFCLSSGLGFSMTNVSIAIGTSFPDALIAGTITANNNSVMLLCNSKAEKWSSSLQLIARHKQEIAEAGYRFSIFGSTGAVPRSAKEFILCALG